MADHYQAHRPHQGRMTPEQRMRDPFMNQMRDFNFPSHFMDNNGGIQDPHLFRSPRRGFPSHGGFEDGFGFNVEDRNPSPMFNNRRDSHVESIPIKVIHEKSANGVRQPPAASSSPPQKHHPFAGGRKTTEIPLPSSEAVPQGSPRLERAHSEPPKSFHQRMSTLQPPPQPIPEKQDEEGQNPITTSASAPSVPGETNPDPTHDPLAQEAPSADNPQIRHIPIVVEGRDAPVFSRKFSDKTCPAAPPSEPTTPMGPPPGPIPMGCSADHLKQPPMEPSSPLPCPEGPIPLPCSPNLLTERGSPPDEPDAEAPTAPTHAASSEPKDPALEKVKSIQDNLAEITRRIEGFTGSKKDKEYLYLDEMLTRHLLSLDGIDSGGKEEIRKIRKESIKSVNRCLSLLDSKAGPFQR